MKKVHEPENRLLTRGIRDVRRIGRLVSRLVPLPELSKRTMLARIMENGGAVRVEQLSVVTSYY